MKKIAWITDSTCVLSDEVCRTHHIYKVPLSVIFGNESFRDGVEISPEAVYEKLASTNEKASTSQPSIGDFVMLYETLRENYDIGVAYHISSALSGTFQTSVQAASMSSFPLEAVDSFAGIHPMSMLLLETVKMVESGTPLETALEHLRNRSKQIEIQFTVGSLDQLHKSGRVKGTQALLGTLLNIRPIFQFENGSIGVKEKVRSQKKAVQTIVTHLKEDIVKHGVEYVSIFHADHEEVAKELQSQLSALVTTPVEVHPVTPVVGVLAGKGTIGVTWVKK